MIDRLASHLLSVVLVLSLCGAGADGSGEGPAPGAPAQPGVPAGKAAPRPGLARVVQDADDADDEEEREGATRRDVTFEDLLVLHGAWEATGQLPHVGRYTITSRWEPVLDGRFLQESRVTTTGEQVVEERNFVGVTPGARLPELWLFGSDGATGHLVADAETPLRREGRLAVSAEALWAVVFEGEVTARPPAAPWRITLSVLSHDAYDLLFERKPGDNWLPITRQRYQRVAEAAALDEGEAR